MEDLSLAIKQAMLGDPLLQKAVQDASDLQEAFAIRRLVADAVSILVASQSLSDNDALRHLRRRSSNEGVSMKEVALKVIFGDRST